MSNMTVTTGANFIPEVWSQKVIKAVRAKLVLANLVWRFDSEVKSSGDTIHIPLISNLAANNKVAGVEVNLQAPTEGVVNLSVNQYKESSFLIEDILAAQSSYDLMSKYTDQAGYAIAKAVDSSVAALGGSFSQTKGTYNTAITTDVVLDSIELLDLADVPQEDRHFVYRPDVKRDLLDLSTYTSKDFVSGAAVETGLIGDLYGAKTYMSTNLVKSGSNTDNMLFHREALALAMQKSPSAEAGRSIKDQGDILVVTSIYGVVETRDNHGVLIKT